jgi:hypothetical protein
MKQNHQLECTHSDYQSYQVYFLKNGNTVHCNKDASNEHNLFEKTFYSLQTVQHRIQYNPRYTRESAVEQIQITEQCKQPLRPHDTGMDMIHEIQDINPSPTFNEKLMRKPCVDCFIMARQINIQKHDFRTIITVKTAKNTDST